MLNSLRSRVALLCVGLAVCPLIIAGIAIAVNSTSAYEQQSLALHRQIAAGVGSEIKAAIEKWEHELVLLDVVYGLGVLEPEEQLVHLSNMLLYQHALQELVLLDAKGQEEIRLSRTSVFVESDLESRAGNEEFLSPATHGSTYFSPVRFDETIREPLVTISVPLFDQHSGGVVSVLVSELRFRIIWDLLGQIELPRECVVYVADQAGRIVAHRNPTIVLSGTTVDLPQTDGRAEGLSGVDVIAARHNLRFGNQELVVVAEQPASGALRSAVTNLLIVTAVICSVLALVITLVLLAARRIVKPIEALVASARAISSGDFSQQVKVSGRDEVGQLATAFNQMVRDLNIAREELKEYSGNLESMVASRTEDLLRKTQELEEANQTKSRFLASMSHELRTPLNAIIGFSELMLDAIPGEINDEQRECLSDIWDSGRHLLNLVSDILDLSKIEAGAMQLKLESLDLAEVINDAVRSVRPILEDNKHRLHITVDKGLPRVSADEQRLRQVLLNLLSNAIKFTPPGGELAIGVSENDGGCQISVADNGIGIREEDQVKIFDVYTRGDTLAGRAIEGAGLGLAVTRQLVEIAGGKMWLESEYGKGSKFSFTIPLSTES